MDIKVYVSGEYAVFRAETEASYIDAHHKRYVSGYVVYYAYPVKALE